MRDPHPTLQTQSLPASSREKSTENENLTVPNVSRALNTKTGSAPSIYGTITSRVNGEWFAFSFTLIPCVVIGL